MRRLSICIYRTFLMLNRINGSSPETCMRIPPQAGTHVVSSRCHMSLGTFTDRPELLEHKPYSTEHQTLRPQIYDLPPGGPRALSQPHMFSISRGSEKQRGGTLISWGSLHRTKASSRMWLSRINDPRWSRRGRKCLNDSSHKPKCAALSADPNFRCSLSTTTAPTWQPTDERQT